MSDPNKAAGGRRLGRTSTSVAVGTAEVVAPPAAMVAAAFNPEMYTFRVWAHGSWLVNGKTFRPLEPVPFNEAELRAMCNGELPLCIEPNA